MKNIEATVLYYPCRYDIGLLDSEIAEILKEFPDINMNKFHMALAGNTMSMSEDNQLLTYHYDLIKAIRCGVENRNLRSYEWD